RTSRRSSAPCRMDDKPSRARSASPERGEPRSTHAKLSGGFKWKEKQPRSDDARNRNSDHLERGYRDRSPRRNDYRRDHFDDRRDRDGPADDYKRHRDRDSGRERNYDSRPHDGGRDKFLDRERPQRQERSGKDAKDTQDKAKKEKDNNSAPPPPQPPSGEPMIIVNINDRLGTKAAIPCFASDSVKAFKAMVAAHIGRQPHEIMLKRQGERPFKDILTLEDYGVSNGVQLDLELDTGD
ncbi:ubiquitin-like protein, partial [Dissoconium aciculare CBS 342.82]|uniref:Ubiquitin-like modifier HUB1 n=1 Tax=Dissoconium aciculare CBS 342.82 TaxID=1314786 RepID=A0A6J3MCN6_9PEZI